MIGTRRCPRASFLAVDGDPRVRSRPRALPGGFRLDEEIFARGLLGTEIVRVDVLAPGPGLSSGSGVLFLLGVKVGVSADADARVTMGGYHNVAGYTRRPFPLPLETVGQVDWETGEYRGVGNGFRFIKFSSWPALSRHVP